jgi:hypothetical protein
MSAGEVALIVTGAVWLAALTILVLLSVQQLTILTKRLDLIAGPESVGESGPALGMALPEEAKPLLAAGAAANGHAQLILLMSATCGPCRAVAEDLRSADLETPLVVLLPGNKEAADEVEALLPPNLDVIRDPDAVQYANVLGIKHTPFALAVKAGRVVGKSPINRVDELLGLAAATEDIAIEPLHSG